MNEADGSGEVNKYYTSGAGLSSEEVPSIRLEPVFLFVMPEMYAQAMFAAWRKWRDKERVAKTRVLGFMGLWDGVLWSQDDWIREHRPVGSAESREWSATRQLGRTTHRQVGNMKLLFGMAALESGQLMNHHRAYLRRLGFSGPLGTGQINHRLAGIQALGNW